LLKFTLCPKRSNSRSDIVWYHTPSNLISVFLYYNALSGGDFVSGEVFKTVKLK
jgi:hypothetical protein